MSNRFTNANYDRRNQAFHFNDRTVNVYNNIAFLCKPLWGTLVYHGIIVTYYVPLVLASFGEQRPEKNI